MKLIGMPLHTRKIELCLHIQWLKESTGICQFFKQLFAQNAFHPSKICKCGRLCAVNKQSLQTWFLRQSMHLNFSTSGWKQMEQLSPEWQYDGIRVALICSIVLFGLLSVIYPWHNGCYCILKHDYKNEKHVTEMKKNHNWNVWFWS